MHAYMNTYTHTNIHTVQSRLNKVPRYPSWTEELNNFWREPSGQYRQANEEWMNDDEQQEMTNDMIINLVNEQKEESEE
jgi:hypothetical protein